jgi:hypothetical protein
VTFWISEPGVGVGVAHAGGDEPHHFTFALAQRRHASGNLGTLGAPASSGGSTLQHYNGDIHRISFRGGSSRGSTQGLLSRRREDHHEPVLELADAVRGQHQLRARMQST